MSRENMVSFSSSSEKGEFVVFFFVGMQLKYIAKQSLQRRFTFIQLQPQAS